MAEPPRVGDTFAGYRIDGVLGRGGMSTVFRAENVRLGNIVALKVLSPELGEDDQFRERFVRESRVASSMNHPNIIPISDAGQERGHLFIVMRYVEGSDLDSVLRHHVRLDPPRCLDVVSQVASALDAAHAKELLHRDVKPANILIESSGVDYRGDHVYLSDFGLTKHTSSTSGLTQTGSFLGSIDYMAPEQIEVGSVDGRADIYGLGCVTFKCLTGSVPFERDSHAAVLWAHLRDEIPKVTALRPELPPTVDDVIARALAKSPDDRYQSARDLVIDLKQALGDSRPAQAPATAQGAPDTVQRAPDTVHGTIASVAGPPLVGSQAPPPRQPPSNESIPEAEGKSPRRQISLLTAAAISVGVLALAGGGAVAGVLLSRDSGSPSGAAGTTSSGAMTGMEHGASAEGAALEQIIPAPLLATCDATDSSLPGAAESVACNPPSRANSLNVVRFEKPSELITAYNAKVRSSGIQPGKGKCSTTRWGGEQPWKHAEEEMSSDGRALCYFRQNDSYIVWTVTSSDVLATAMINGKNHAELYRWWSFWHHQFLAPATG